VRILILSDSVPNPDGWTGGSQQPFLRLKYLADKHEFILAYVNWGGEPEPAAGLSSRFQLIPLPLPYVPPLSVPVHSRSALYWRLSAWRHAALGRPYLFHARRRPELQAALAELLPRLHADVVHPHGLLMLYELPSDTRRILADLPDVHSRLVRRQMQAQRRRSQRWQLWLEYRKIERIEAQQYGRAHSLLTVSALDQAAVRRLAPGKPVEMIPNAVDTDFFRPSTLAEAEATLLFSGTLNYWPNVEALQYFCAEILPRVRQVLPRVRLQIAGRHPAPEVLALADNSVTILSSVPDMRPLLAQATLSIVPLKNGAGTRLKILEAWAMQKAVVSTSVGAEGLAGEHLQHLWLADDPAAFAAAIVHLIEQPALRQRLGACGRELVETHYSLRSAAGQLEKLYERIVA